MHHVCRYRPQMCLFSFTGHRIIIIIFLIFQDPRRTCKIQPVRHPARAIVPTTRCCRLIRVVPPKAILCCAVLYYTKTQQHVVVVVAVVVDVVDSVALGAFVRSAGIVVLRRWLVWFLAGWLDNSLARLSYWVSNRISSLQDRVCLHFVLSAWHSSFVNPILTHFIWNMLFIIFFSLLLLLLFIIIIIIFFSFAFVSSCRPSRNISSESAPRYAPSTCRFRQEDQQEQRHIGKLFIPIVRSTPFVRSFVRFVYCIVLYWEFTTEVVSE